MQFNVEKVARKGSISFIWQSFNMVCDMNCGVSFISLHRYIDIIYSRASTAPVCKQEKCMPLLLIFYHASGRRR